jgi:hypothetical protein
MVKFVTGKGNLKKKDQHVKTYLANLEFMLKVVLV